MSRRSIATKDVGGLKKLSPRATCGSRDDRTLLGMECVY